MTFKFVAKEFKPGQITSRDYNYKRTKASKSIFGF